MIANNSFDSSSTDYDVFYEERLLDEGSLVRTNTSAVLNFTQQSGAMARGYRNLLLSFTGATDCDIRIRLQWAHIPLWV